MITNQIIKKYIPCTCSDMYKDRNLTDVDCVHCNYFDLIDQIINECTTTYIYQFMYSCDTWNCTPYVISTHLSRKGAVLAKIKHKKRVIRNTIRVILAYDIDIRNEIKIYHLNAINEQMSWDIVKLKLKK